jgi:hypothetical protein
MLKTSFTSSSKDNLTLSRILKKKANINESGFNIMSLKAFSLLRSNILIPLQLEAFLA